MKRLQLLSLFLFLFSALEQNETLQRLSIRTRNSLLVTESTLRYMIESMQCNDTLQELRVEGMDYDSIHSLLPIIDQNRCGSRIAPKKDSRKRNYLYSWLLAYAGTEW